MTAIWQAGTTYVPGALVTPSKVLPAVATQPTNPGFETADLTGWTTADNSRWLVKTGDAYADTYFAQVSGNGVTSLENTIRVPINPGDMATVSAFGKITNAGHDDASFQVVLEWHDASDAILPGYVPGNLVSGAGGHYVQSSASGPAPSGAVSFTISLSTNTGSHGSTVAWDAAAFSYVLPARPAGLIFKATQAAPGKSGTAEPVWPDSTGVPVTDNQVTWEGVIATRLVWKAVPMLQSGDTEPTWPTANGASVHDGTIDWTASSAQITDPNCPQSKIVAIAASKVYVGDNDIIRYCATVNPLDWSSPNDAGYLPFGLSTYGSNPVAAMNLYRSNLVPFNAEGFQMWQVDPDPANTALLDALPIASSYNKAMAPVANDLLFLSSQGVRSIGIAASSTNLQAGDVGMPIDVLVKAAMVATVDEPRATFLPALGQFWLAINAADRTSCSVFVYTINQVGQVGKWSRYVFPFPIDEFAQLNDNLYLRSDDDVLMYDATVVEDFADDARAVFFDGIVQFPWLDMGTVGADKQLIGFDLVGTGVPTFAVGYDQTNGGSFTDDFTIPADTVPGMIIPLPIMAPSMSVRVTYPGGQRWQLQAINLYLQGQRPGA